ncbi:hypothetical protein JTE90_020594 [Oedothorax gibbosus]|uniref:Peptidase S1 domain-containing protein n=1 Tax=Oedothorax gibbosus TaxID=931172 RepID=A0AAV6VYP8_9ARAC|nr:hypothetical protein JTE90_020594 [Oedothorax gibbosus]
MGWLPGFVFGLLVLRTCASVDSTTTADQHSDHALKCPGVCRDEHACHTTLNETDCEHGTVCCIDHFEDITTTEFADFDFSTEGTVDTASEAEESDSTFIYSTEGPEENDGYTYVYEDENGQVVAEPSEEQVDVSEKCPGACIPTHTAETCDYVVATDSVCEEGLTCCLTESDLANSNDQYAYEVDESGIVERDAEYDSSEDSCPGTCVHPSHAMFCEEILPQFSCPLNSKCCLRRSVERSIPDDVVECTGQCLPSNMYGYCFPPNELLLGASTCGRGTACCMSQNDKQNSPPSIRRMQFPNFPRTEFVPDPSRVVLGHLAIDEAGTVYKVSTNGQIFPLPRLTTANHARGRYTKITSYPRLDGEIAIYSDAAGGLYQQFFPRQSIMSDAPANPQSPRSPLVRQPVYQFESQTSDHAANFKESSATTNSEDEVLQDIILPDDDDEAPVTTNTPVVHDEKNSRPPCPGSCMSFFLRFTCFRGYATYDGFTCPGRSVCCARLKDIEDHEQYLKSLSPYFNVPPTNRDSNLPRCGIKGRRDTPRVIGGKDSLPGEWCWQVAIINVQNQYICGGALIDNSWVLTAAHCVVGPMKENQALFVRVGVTDLKSPEDNSRGKTIRVLSTFVHHNFNSMNLDNNIALLRLQKPVQLNSGVCVICLPTSGQMPKDDSKCTVTGYGFVSKDGDMSLKIREAQIPIIDDMECMANVTEALTNPFILPSSSFCAGGKGQQDACQGDAGGALACEVGGYHELVGLVSWGLGCGRNDVPSIYIKVPSFMGWINQIISSSSFLMSLN